MSLHKALTFALILPTLLLVQSCSTQTLFDTLGAKDKESRRVARDIPFGDHDRQKLDIYAPKEQTGDAPVLMFIYGGSWENGDKDGYDFVGRAFAARGFVTIIADYRLVPEVVFPAFVQDGAAALRWITDNIAEYGGDPDRIYLVGHSAGGYNAITLALDKQYLTAQGLDSDTIDGAAGIAGPYDFYPFDVDSTINAFGHTESPVETTQPIAFATADAPPILLLTGMDDTVVKPRNVKALESVLTQNGTPVQSIYYDGLDHVEPVLALSVTFRKKAPVLNDIVTFFEEIDETLSAN